MDMQADADPLVDYVWARRMRDSGHIEDAWKPAVRAAKAIPASAADDRSARILALGGYLAAAYGDSEQAESFLRRAASIHRSDALVYLGRGVLAMRRNDARAAESEFAGAARLDPGRAESWTRLGTAYLSMGEPGEAIDPLNRAVQLAPNEASNHADLGEALAQVKRFAEAAVQYRHAVELGPGGGYSAMLAISEANAANTDADYDRASVALETLLDSSPEDDDVRALLAGLHIRFCRFEDARDQLDICVARNPLNADAWSNLAFACEKIGDRAGADVASTRFRKLIDLEERIVLLRRQALLRPNDGGVRLQLWRELRSANRKHDAFTELRRAAALSPRDPNIQRILAGEEAAVRSMPGGEEALKREAVTR